MANVSSNRSPSPLPSRNCRNSETNSSNRKSYNGNPFAKPNILVNPRDSIPPTPAASTDQTKRNSISRKSIGSSSIFKDEKENNIKDVLRSPAKGCTKNFMAPTISAASKFTPSPRKKILGEKNELSRTSIQFVDKDFDLKPESKAFDQITVTKEGSEEPKMLSDVTTTTPVHEVTFSSITDATETLSDVTENSDFVKIRRPFCCSPQTSPIIAPLETNSSSIPPYDPKKNFLSPRPQFLRYKPNPRIGNLLNKENGNDGYGEEDVIRLDDSFNVSDISSDTEEKENEKPSELGDLVHGSSDGSSEEKQSELGDSVHGSSEEKESELGDLVCVSSKDSSEIVSDGNQSGSMVVKPSELGDLVHGSSDGSSEEKQSELGDSVHGSSEEKESELGDLVCVSSKDSSEIVSDGNQSGSMVVKPSKPRFFTRSKTVSLLILMFLVACFSVSFTDTPPMDLPIYKDVSFSEIYHESLKFAAFAKESFDEAVENLKPWFIEFISYLSDQISHFGSSTNRSVQFYNLTTSPIQEEFIFNRHIGTDYTQVNMPEVNQEFEEDEMEIFEELNDDEIDEFETEEVFQSDEVIESDNDSFLETKSEDRLDEIASSSPVSEIASETAKNDVKIESSSIDSSVEEVSSDSLSSLLNRSSMNTIYIGGFCMVILAVSATFYMMKRQSNAAKRADYNVDRESSSSSGSSNAQKRHKKKGINDKRESMASSSSSSDFSRASLSYGSFTTFERIPVKHGDEVMLTPIRRSSRLLKTQVTAS